MENNKKVSRSENMIKGRLAEALIEGLFLDLGFDVYRYGMENTIPAIMKVLKRVKTEVADNIRKMPDFVIQHPKSYEVYFVEVKFRANEMLTLSELGKDYPYKNCLFIVVSKKHIKCISYNELKEHKNISPQSRNYLGNRKEFLNENGDENKIIQYCQFAEKFFENV